MMMKLSALMLVALCCLTQSANAIAQHNQHTVVKHHHIHYKDGTTKTETQYEPYEDKDEPKTYEKQEKESYEDEPDNKKDYEKEDEKEDETDNEKDYEKEGDEPKENTDYDTYGDADDGGDGGEDDADSKYDAEDSKYDEQKEEVVDDGYGESTTYKPHKQTKPNAYHAPAYHHPVMHPVVYHHPVMHPVVYHHPAMHPVVYHQPACTPYHRVRRLMGANLPPCPRNSDDGSATPTVVIIAVVTLVLLIAFCCFKDRCSNNGCSLDCCTDCPFPGFNHSSHGNQPKITIEPTRVSMGRSGPRSGSNGWTENGNNAWSQTNSGEWQQFDLNARSDLENRLTTQENLPIASF